MTAHDDRRSAYWSDEAPPPAGSYSQAVSGGGLVFLAGQTARRADGSRLNDVPFEDEAAAVMQNLSHTARAAGCEVSDALQVTVYLKHPARDSQAFDKVYRRYLREPFPARTTVHSDLPYCNVEVDAILLRPRAADGNRDNSILRAEADHEPRNQPPPPSPRRCAPLNVHHAPAQQRSARPARDAPALVDFSHGDVAAFPPPQHAVEAVERAVRQGGRWAYTPYRGSAEARTHLAHHLGLLTNSEIDAEREVLVTAGTQAALFLALAAVVERGDLVAIGSPDYFAYRKIARYLEAQPLDVHLDYRDPARPGEFDLTELRAAFAAGARVFVFSNPNNPAGVVYAPDHLRAVCRVAAEYAGLIVVAQLYCRQIFDGRPYLHLRDQRSGFGNCITVLGPSKTESLSGYRLGVAVGPGALIDRMEALQGLVTLRAPGYSQAALTGWFTEPDGWLEKRVAAHQVIRDDLMAVIDGSGGVASARRSEGGSYLFIRLDSIRGRLDEFTARLYDETRVVVTRGSEFGDHPDEVRVNFSQDRASARAAMERMVAFAERFSSE